MNRFVIFNFLIAIMLSVVKGKPSARLGTRVRRGATKVA